MVNNKVSAEHYPWGEGCQGWHLARSERLSVIQEEMPLGTEEVRHYHHHAEQFFFVLAGQAVLELDGHEHYLGPQDGLHVPAGKPHQLRNQASQTLSFLVISTPPSHGDRVESPK